METYLVQFYKAGGAPSATGQTVFASNDFGAATKAYDESPSKVGPGWVVLWNQKSRMKLQTKQILKAPK
jgi:Tfp pilus assembly protein FimT